MEETDLSKEELRKLKDKERKRVIRESLDFKTKENERKRQLRSIKRTDEEWKNYEKKRITDSMRRSRTNEERRALEQNLNTKARRQSRLNEELRDQEKQRDACSRKQARLEENRRAKDQQRDSDSRRLARLDEVKRTQERQRDTDSRREARQDREKRAQERQRDAVSRKQVRLNEERRAHEQKLNTDSRKTARLDIKRRQIEREEDKISKKLKRCELNATITLEDLCAQYENNIKQGPTVICNSCFGLFFDSSIRKVCSITFLNNGVDRFLETICYISDKLKFCISCHRDIVNGKVPTLSKVNGLGFPEIPEELKNLTEVEIRLVSPRIPFMQIRELSKRDRQYSIKGNVVNVPISVETSVNILPRTFDNTHTIQLKLKRKICYKSYYLYETIRPAVCFKAAVYLINTTLYKIENIKLSESWLDEHNSNTENFIILDEDKNIDNNICYKSEIINSNRNNVLEEMIETEKDANAAYNDTLWSDTDQTQTIEFAPEGIFPLSLLRDEYAEELSFHTIYCGEPRKTNKNISYANICKWELRHYDRRCCNVAYIFFKLKKRQLQMITKQVSLHLRKRKNFDKITAGQLLNKDFVDKICKVDDGYRFLKVDRASPPYWQSRKKEVLAMIRQLGIPTFFITLSAAETRWRELLVILMKTVRNKDINEEETNNLDYKDKCELISKDPITCSRYFDKRIREMFHVLQHPKGPFSKHLITDTYVRVEFQHRGSPHVHCLLWLSKAPVYSKENDNAIKSCLEFIDSYITTCSEIDGSLIQLQSHGHSKSCLKFKGD